MHETIEGCVLTLARNVLDGFKLKSLGRHVGGGKVAWDSRE